MKRWLLLVISLAMVSGCKSLREYGDEKAAREAERDAAALDAKVRKRRAADEAAHERADAERAAQSEQQLAEAQAARAAAQSDANAAVSEAAALTPAQRAARVREACSVDRCDPKRAQVFLDGAKTPAERASLEAILSAGSKASEAKAREGFAKIYESQLLTKRMNPESVIATGPERRTMKVQGWFCTRQYVYDVQNGGLGAELRGAGFKRFECSGAGQDWSGDL